MVFRYYSILRPLMLGSIPIPHKEGQNITTIVNFENGRTYCPEIDRPAWGYVEYTSPLEPKEISDYELVQGPEDSSHE